jgi:hypothetical protein
MWRAVVTQPLNQSCIIHPQGAIDQAAGEFWVNNPYFIVTERNNLSAYESNYLFLNYRGKDSIDVSFASHTDIDADSRSAIVADFDGDLRTDLLVGNAGGGSVRLFLNRFPQTGNYLNIRLRGTQSNRAGIGARIVAEANGQRISRELFSPMGFMGQSPAELILGIGSASVIDQLTIYWPSGIVQTFEDVKANQQVVIEEENEKLAQF